MPGVRGPAVPGPALEPRAPAPTVRAEPVAPPGADQPRAAIARWRPGADRERRHVSRSRLGRKPAVAELARPRPPALAPEVLEASPAHAASLEPGQALAPSRQPAAP